MHGRRHLVTLSPRHLFILLAWLLALLPRPALADDYDRWYIIEMGGGRAGWAHMVQTTDGERITTSSTMNFKLGRAKEGVGIGMEGTFVESKAGKPISCRTVMRLGSTPTTMDATYREKNIDIALTQAGGATRQTKPLPEGQWLTPAAASEFVTRRLAAKAESIEVRTVDAAGGMDPLAALEPVLIKHADCRATTLEVAGKQIPVTRCITTSSTQPSVESIEFLDANGVPVRSETHLGSVAMVMTASTKEEAMNDKAAGVGPEMMTTTFVKPDRRIDHPRSTTTAKYTVTATDGKLPALPSTGAQRFAAAGEKSGTLTLDTAQRSPAPEADAADPQFTKGSTTINTDDAEVRRIAAEAAKGAPQDKPGRAEALRRFVYDFITEKDLTVGFANASEIVRTRRGDCSEHAVLLATLLRSEGIPSRVACGLIYADEFAGARDIFGYHMWAQALLEVNGKPTWVDLDGTLPPRVSFDATHIALGVSSLADGQSQDALIAIATVIGRLQLKVESIE